MQRLLALGIALVLIGCFSSEEADPPAHESRDSPRSEGSAIGGREYADPGEVDWGSGLALLEDWMTGTFSNEQQAAADTGYFDIRLHISRIWPERAPGLWLYLEQWLAGRDEYPYRQRVFHVTALSDSTFRSRTFTIPGSLRFANHGRKSDPLGALSPDSLTARAGCDLLLVQREDSFIGSNQGRECRSDLQGATYATSEVRITPNLLYSWDRGFDDAGTQLWGPFRGGYEFRKTE